MFASILTAFALLGTQPGLAPHTAEPAAISQPAAETVAAAEAGDAEAQWEVAWYRLNRQTELETPDPEAMAEIRALLNAAADQDHGQALNLLAILAREDGREDEAMAYFERAHETGAASGSLNLGIALLLGEDAAAQARGIDILRGLSRREDIDEATRRIAGGYVGYAKSIGAGDLALDHENGFTLLQAGIEADPDNALFHYMLARYYESGTTTARDPETALHHFLIASDNGHGPAAWKAGMAYLNGEGTEIDELEAFRLVNLSAISGYEEGMISLAVMYALGQGIPVNYAQARTWYGEAASRGNAHAMRGLGVMHLYGEGGEPDAALGVALLQLAAEGDDYVAERILDDVSDQLPETSDWEAAVAQSRAWFMAEHALEMSDLHGGQTRP